MHSVKSISGIPDNLGRAHTQMSVQKKKKRKPFFFFFQVSGMTNHITRNNKMKSEISTEAIFCPTVGYNIVPLGILVQ